jgi:hypothetical protein
MLMLWLAAADDAAPQPELRREQKCSSQHAVTIESALYAHGIAHLRRAVHLVHLAYVHAWYGIMPFVISIVCMFGMVQSALFMPASTLSSSLQLLQCSK